MNVLIADDHKVTIAFFASSIGNLFKDKEKNLSECICCKEAFESIELALAENTLFELAILDYRMPPFPEQGIQSGKDLAVLLQKKMPDCKIIIITGNMDSITIFDVIHHVNPDAFLFKSDFSPSDLPQILETISKGEKYKSEGILKKYQEDLNSDFLIHSINRKILQAIDKGWNISDISEELHLSKAAINKRIFKMKKSMNVKEVNGLLKEAKKRGYV